MDELIESRTAGAALIQGVVIALVTDNKDPENLARVKVKYPLFANQLESNWARMTTFMAGKDRGGYFLPEVGDEVLVAFEFGNINAPFVIGALYNGVDTPPQNNADGENNIREIRSRSGHVIRFDDKSSAEKVEIIDKTGKNTLVIDSNANTISISSAQDIKLEAKQGAVKIDAQQIELNGTDSVSIKGGQVSLQADSSLSAKAGASMSLKADASVSVKGITINLN